MTQHHWCKKCTSKFIQKCDLEKHIREAHEEVVYNCATCDYLTNHLKDLKNHVQKFHKDVLREFKCDLCPQKYFNMSHLNQHMNNVHLSIKHQCPDCEFSAKTKSILKIHVESIHKGIKYPCDQCDHRATQKTHLREHKSAIHSKTKYKCELCDEYETSSQGSLQIHINTSIEWKI